MFRHVRSTRLLGNARLYGTHPYHWYLTAGFPAITGLLLPFLLLDLLRGRSHGGWILWTIIYCYTMVHSFSEHKEFRFLMPLMPLFCVLSGPGVCQFLRNHSKKSLLIAVAVLANVIPTLYLGLFHQRGSVDVNRAIVRRVGQEPQTYTVHYLMGCHSTPLLSHLHAPPVKFNTWTLDCSPDCRSRADIMCESDVFANDPGQFMENTYFRCTDFVEDSCVTDFRIFYPDFLVSSSRDVPFMKSRIATMGLKEVARFPQQVVGIRLGKGLIEIGTESFSSESFTTKSLFSGFVEVSLEEIILYESSDVHPNY